MNLYTNLKLLAATVLVGLSTCTAVGHASYGLINVGWNGPVHHHSEGFRGYPGHGWGGGGYYRSGPNVIINVPVEPYAPPYPYYVRECDNVQVCNDYNECWIERYCN